MLLLYLPNGQVAQRSPRR